MQYAIKAPTALQGTISLPASKSISNRALIINALSHSNAPIRNLSDCDDTQAMWRVLNSGDCNFDIGAAGTAMRFLTAFLSKIVGEWTITGSARMKQRPIGLLVEALNSLGAKIECVEKEGFPPLRIFGSALKGGEISLDGSVSSQYISALLMLAPTMEKGLTLHLKGNVISKPYISMTLQLMEDFGVKTHWENNTICVAPQDYFPVEYSVESDWSAASYWYEMLSICGEGELFLKGLRRNSTQGDAKIAELFENLGVKTSFKKDGVIISSNKKYTKKFICDFVEQPDVAQSFAVACCLRGIPFLFSGLQSLKIKETDRIAALIAELGKLGYCLEESGNGILEWSGKRNETAPNAIIQTYDDHRMAMAFAPAAFAHALSIANPEVVSKSYPSFWEDLKAAGFVFSPK